MRKHLLKVATYKPGKPIEELQRELGIRQIIKLASNENPFPPSPLVLKAIAKAASKVNRYPESNLYYLRKRLSQLFSIDESEIIFGNGSDELIVFAVRSLVSPGQEIITAYPTFLIYKIAAMVEQIRITEIPMKDFKYDLQSIRSAINENTKLIFIANPDNPTGSYLTHQEIAWFLSDLPEDVFVFFDEAYFEFGREMPDWPDTISYVKQRKNVIVSRTFSKYYGLAGLRIGYAFARKDIIDVMNRVREPFNVNLIAQEAALAALESRSYYKQIYREIERGRDFLKQELSSLNLQVLPSATNFLLVKIGEPASEVVEMLLKRGIIVRHMRAWGLPEYIRVTVGKTSENKKFIKELKKIIKTLGK